jgi:DNA-binding response OmpR family regulator
MSGRGEASIFIHPGERGKESTDMRTRNGPTLLVADDDRKSMLSVVQVANGLGYNCVTATTGATAWREFSRFRFDLVVADLNMPGGDGAVLARRIRTCSGTPVVLLTELGPTSLDVCGIADLAGIEVLAKPFSAAALRDAIETNIRTVLEPAQTLSETEDAA